MVGYGADPNAVIARVQALNPLAIVRGNHDKVACGLEQADGFNSVAKSAARWTLEHTPLDPGTRCACRAPVRQVYEARGVGMQQNCATPTPMIPASSGGGTRAAISEPSGARAR